MKIDPDLSYLPKKLLEANNKLMFANVMSCVTKSNPDDIKKHKINISGMNWYVFEGPSFKIIGNEAHDYNEFYDYVTGLTVRFGKEVKDDPTWSPIGNSIADIECVSGKCPKINGKNCKFCYKSNGGDIAHCMTLNEAEKLVDFINQNHQLQQIAWGITGYYTNPDFGKILEMCCHKHVTPNYTTNGVDLDDAAIEHTLRYCGRVAVSCYDGAKDICYSTIKKFGDKAKEMKRNFPCNIHVVLSKDTYNHVMDVLNDAKDKKIENLGAIVILRMKNVGRAKNLDPHIPDEMYETIVKFCLDNDIKFGFDSCGCHRVEDVLKKLGKANLLSSLEPCESSRFSAYWNVKSQFFNCSFCEQLDGHVAIDQYKYDSFTDFWHSDDVKSLRFPKNGWVCRSCPFMKID